MFGSKRRLVRRFEWDTLCPKPGTAPVTWQVAAMFSSSSQLAAVKLLPRTDRPASTACSHRRHQHICHRVQLLHVRARASRTAGGDAAVTRWWVRGTRPIGDDGSRDVSPAL